MLQIAVDWLIYSILGLSPASPLAGALNFFVYDAIKIMLLLAGMITVIGFARTYLPPGKVKKWLSGSKSSAYLGAAVFGAVTPFCSCSSIPLFLGFLEAGVPLGITFTFLITSPLINEYLVILMLGFFGWRITALYVVSGILIGVTSGLVLGSLKLEKYLVADLIAPETELSGQVRFSRLSERLRFGVNEAWSIVGKLWLWVLVGVGAGALLHNYVPQEAIQSLLSKVGIFSVPLAVVLGVPLYGSCAAIVPIAVVLFQKGLPLGTALAFMMAITALSLPEAIMLRRAIKLPLIAIFFAVTTVAIICTGYMFNWFQALI